MYMHTHTQREKIWALVLFCGWSETSAPIVTPLLKRDLWENSTLDSTVLSVYQQGITSQDVLKCGMQGSAKP